MEEHPIMASAKVGPAQMDWATSQDARQLAGGSMCVQSHRGLG